MANFTHRVRGVRVCEVLVRKYAQNGFFRETAWDRVCYYSHLLGHLLALPKEETSVRVVDVYAGCLGQSVFPFLQS